MKLNVYFLEPPFAVFLDEGVVVDGAHYNRISGTRRFAPIVAHHRRKLDQVPTASGRLPVSTHIDHRADHEMKRPNDFFADVGLESVDGIAAPVGAERVAFPSGIIYEEAGHSVGVVSVVAVVRIACLEILDRLDILEPS